MAEMKIPGGAVRVGVSNARGKYRIAGKMVYTTADRAKVMEDAGLEVEQLEAPLEELEAPE